MKASWDSGTHASLLGRLHRDPANALAWEEFVQRYGRRIYLWCRGWNLQDADAQDVTQNVLVEIARQMRTFRYDPSRSFRAWLKVVTHGAWCDYLARRPERGRGSGDSEVLRLLHTAEASDDLAQKLEEEHERAVMEEASARVRQRVEPRTWDAFRLLALDGLPGSEVAAQLGMTVSAVFVSKCRVQKLAVFVVLATTCARTSTTSSVTACHFSQSASCTPVPWPERRTQPRSCSRKRSPAWKKKVRLLHERMPVRPDAAMSFERSPGEIRTRVDRSPSCWLHSLPTKPGTPEQRRRHDALAEIANARAAPGASAGTAVPGSAHGVRLGELSGDARPRPARRGCVGNAKESRFSLCVKATRAGGLTPCSGL